MAKRRKNNGYQYRRDRNSGQWFVLVRGPIRRKDAEHGPFETQGDAFKFVQEHASAKGNNKFINPSKIPVHFTGGGPALSNQIPGNATIKVQHNHQTKHGKRRHGKHKNRSGGGQRMPTKSFDEVWQAGIRRFIEQPTEQVAA